jgi:hypothetical protein
MKGEMKKQSAQISYFDFYFESEDPPILFDFSTKSEEIKMNLKEKGIMFIYESSLCSISFVSSGCSNSEGLSVSELKNLKSPFSF